MPIYEIGVWEMRGNRGLVRLMRTVNDHPRLHFFAYVEQCRFVTTMFPLAQYSNPCFVVKILRF